MHCYKQTKIKDVLIIICLILPGFKVINIVRQVVILLSTLQCYFLLSSTSSSSPFHSLSRAFAPIRQMQLPLPYARFFIF